MAKFCNAICSFKLLFVINKIFYIFHATYRIRRIIGGVFNLAVWRIIFNPPNLNNAVSGL